MNRESRGDGKSQAEGNCKEAVPSALKPSPWTRRKFLANSTGLAIAGAIGGLAAQLPASAGELASDEGQTPQRTPHPSR